MAESKRQILAGEVPPDKPDEKAVTDPHTTPPKAEGPNRKMERESNERAAAAANNGDKTEAEQAEQVDVFHSFSVTLPESIVDFLAGTEPEQADDPAMAQLEIMRRILEADTLEGIFENNQLADAADFLNMPLTVRTVRWQKSDFKGTGRYAVVDAVDPYTQREVTFSVGAVNVLAQLWKLQRGDHLPISVKLVESPRPTRSGFRPYWLALAPEVPIAG